MARNGRHTRTSGHCTQRTFARRMRLRCAPVGYVSSSSRRAGWLARKRSNAEPGGSAPVCCCHLSAWPTSASKRLGGAVTNSAHTAAASAARRASRPPGDGHASRGSKCGRDSRCSNLRYRSASSTFREASTALERSSARAVSSSRSSIISCAGARAWWRVSECVRMRMRVLFGKGGAPGRLARTNPPSCAVAAAAGPPARAGHARERRGQAGTRRAFALHAPRACGSTTSHRPAWISALKPSRLSTVLSDTCVRASERALRRLQRCVVASVAAQAAPGTPRSSLRTTAPGCSRGRTAE